MPTNTGVDDETFAQLQIFDIKEDRRGTGEKIPTGQNNKTGQERPRKGTSCVLHLADHE